MKNCLDYKGWEKDNRPFLEALCGKDVVVSYTGGKDCSVILHFLLDAARAYDFKFQVHSALFPVHVFTAPEIEKLSDYWKQRGVDIVWHKLENTDEEFEQAKSEGLSPCTVCHQRKREYLFSFLKNSFPAYDNVVFIVGYTLWDLVSYSLEQLLGSEYALKKEDAPYFDGRKLKDRFLQTSQRFYPFFTLEEGLTIYKPMLKYNDPDINSVVQAAKIPLSTSDCEYKPFRPKRIFSEYYTRMDLRFDYQQVLEFGRKALSLHDVETYADFKIKEFLSDIL